jgi:hypothetical protein
VTKGKTSGPVKAFIDDVLQKDGKNLMVKKGMMPLLEE